MNNKKLIEIKDFKLSYVFYEIDKAERESLIYSYWNRHPRFRFIKEAALNSKMLDVGAGTGGLVFWLDYGEPYRKDIQLHAVSNIKGEYFHKYASYRIADLNKDTLEWPDEYFDCIMMSHLFEHLSDPEFFLTEISRVLKPNGFIYIEVPHPKTKELPPCSLFKDINIDIIISNFYDDSTHFQTYGEEELLQMVLRKMPAISIERGIILNPYLEDKLLSFGIQHNDTESLLYGYWLKTSWAYYIKIKKTC